jgi:hypothetical protein
MTASPLNLNLQLSSTISGRRCVSRLGCSAARGHGVGLILAALAILDVPEANDLHFLFLNQAAEAAV